MAPPNGLLSGLLLARPISASDGVAAQRRNIARLGLGDACQARLFQFPVDADGSLVGPSDHGEPTQGTRECDQRRHRSILVVHVSAPMSAFSPKPACAAIALLGLNGAAR